MYIVSNVKIKLNEQNIVHQIAKKLMINPKDILNFKYYKKAIDCRDKENIFFLCHFLVEIDKQVEKKIIKNKDVRMYEPYILDIKKVQTDETVYVIGTGPAGLFASYILALSGVKVIVVERGNKVEKRIEDIEKFFKTGILDENSNMQYGEGGAGTFSDGKLTTNINDKRIEFIKETFIKFGASEDISYLSKPHIGSDVLINVIKNFRNELIKLGVKFLFNTTLVDIEESNHKLNKIILLDNKSNATYSCECSKIVLATGHSARDVFYMLNKHNVKLERKPFSIGVRIEHKQSEINKSQYGEKYYNHPSLPAADYKLAVHLDNGRSLYTFCMCPGGMVVASSSDKESIVTNGMSYYKRNLENANSALLVNVLDTDLAPGLFAGIEFQEKYEKLAYSLSKSYRAPCQMYKDLVDNNKTLEFNSIKPSYMPGVFYTNLRECLPEFVIDTLIKGIPLMNKKIQGFANPDSLLIAPETRSSSPIRITRDESYQTNISGIYPCGEGSGYSSGITTSALDGIRVAYKVLESIK